MVDNEQRRALNRCKRAVTEDNRITFNRLRAAACRTIFAPKERRLDHNTAESSGRVMEEDHSNRGTSVFKPVAAIDYNDEMICNPDNIADSGCATCVSSTHISRLQRTFHNERITVRHGPDDIPKGQKGSS